MVEFLYWVPPLQMIQVTLGHLIGFVHVSVYYWTHAVSLASTSAFVPSRSKHYSQKADINCENPYWVPKFGLRSSIDCPELVRSRSLSLWISVGCFFGFTLESSVPSRLRSQSDSAVWVAICLIFFFWVIGSVLTWIRVSIFENLSKKDRNRVMDLTRSHRSDPSCDWIVGSCVWILWFCRLVLQRRSNYWISSFFNWYIYTRACLQAACPDLCDCAGDCNILSVFGCGWWTRAFVLITFQKVRRFSIVGSVNVIADVFIFN